MYLTYSQKKK